MVAEPQSTVLLQICKNPFYITDVMLSDSETSFIAFSPTAFALKRSPLRGRELKVFHFVQDDTVYIG